MKIMGNCFQVSNFVIIVITADYSGNILIDNFVPPLCFNNLPTLNLAPFSLSQAFFFFQTMYEFPYVRMI